MRVLTGVGEKARGLLGTRADAEPVILVGCASIHTVGMRYPLDVAFVSPGGIVLKVVWALPPGRVVTCRPACAVVERPASEGPWLRDGDELALCVKGACDEKGEGLWKRI